jgi:hypothetical protein
MQKSMKYSGLSLHDHVACSDPDDRYSSYCAMTGFYNGKKFKFRFKFKNFIVQYMTFVKIGEIIPYKTLQ